MLGYKVVYEKDFRHLAGLQCAMYSKHVHGHKGLSMALGESALE